MSRKGCTWEAERRTISGGEGETRRRGEARPATLIFGHNYVLDVYESGPFPRKSCESLFNRLPTSDRYHNLPSAYPFGGNSEISLSRYQNRPILIFNKTPLRWVSTWRLGNHYTLPY